VTVRRSVQHALCTIGLSDRLGSQLRAFLI
jgi:hypothetical protein